MIKCSSNNDSHFPAKINNTTPSIGGSMMAFVIKMFCGGDRYYCRESYEQYRAESIADELLQRELDLGTSPELVYGKERRTGNREY